MKILRACTDSSSVQTLCHSERRQTVSQSSVSGCGREGSTCRQTSWRTADSGRAFRRCASGRAPAGATVDWIVCRNVDTRIPDCGYVCAYCTLALRCTLCHSGGTCAVCDRSSRCGASGGVAPSCSRCCIVCRIPDIYEGLEDRRWPWKNQPRLFFLLIRWNCRPVCNRRSSYLDSRFPETSWRCQNSWWGLGKGKMTATLPEVPKDCKGEHPAKELYSAQQEV